MRDVILITGGAGFIGSHLVEYFLERTSYQVAVIDRFDEFSVVRKFDDRVAVVAHDLRNPLINAGELADIAPRVKYVIHAAAGSHVDRSIVDPLGFVSDNVIGTVHMLEYVRRYLKPEKTLLFSTDEVVGPANDNETFNEFSGTAPGNPYAASKAGAESVAVAYANTYGMPITISRCSNVYGERQHSEKFIPLCIAAIREGRKVLIHARNGVPSSRLYLHVTDVCRAVQLILEQGDTLSIGEKTGRFNIASNREVSNKVIAWTIAEFLGLPLDFELVEDVPHRPRHDQRYSISFGRLHALGWEPRIGIEQGLRGLCQAALEAA